MAVLEQAFGILKIDDASNAPVDLSGQTAMLTIESSRNVGEYYVLGSDAAKSTDGKLKWSARLEFYITTGAAEAYQHLLNWYLPASGTPGARTVTVQSPDGTSGSLDLTGEMRIESLSPLITVDASSSDPMKVTANLRGDGVFVKSTVA